ncbi:hypothetical protein C8034_v003482 [Colletotrichum sidae]|uniref:Uncharacterized protein n=1 Tax=Colletotrichum sidae TaxID=1347389 RepID=A0A4R8TA66_9PEZI|nr:hypothetical protein C8034_v003482 [Colletotrichum sidae]
MALNWKEEFLLFYWDFESRVPDMRQKVNDIIESKLLHYHASRPRSWNILLRDLMKTLRSKLSSSTCPDLANELTWLDSAPCPPVAPFIDWTRLDTQLLHLEDGSSSNSVLAVLDHIQNVAYGPLEPLDAPAATMTEAWLANPSLVDFQRKLDIKPWSVRLAPSEDTYFSAEVDSFFRRSNCVTGPGNEFNLHIDLESGQATLERHGLPEGRMTTRTLNLAKLLYGGMLKWSLDARLGHLTSFTGTMEIQTAKWLASKGKTTMDVSKYPLHRLLRVSMQAGTSNSLTIPAKDTIAEAGSSQSCAHLTTSPAKKSSSETSKTLQKTPDRPNNPARKTAPRSTRAPTACPVKNADGVTTTSSTKASPVSAKRKGVAAKPKEMAQKKGKSLTAAQRLRRVLTPSLAAPVKVEKKATVTTAAQRRKKGLPVRKAALVKNIGTDKARDDNREPEGLGGEGIEAQVTYDDSDDPDYEDEAQFHSDGESD